MFLSPRLGDNPTHQRPRPLSAFAVAAKAAIFARLSIWLKPYPDTNRECPWKSGSSEPRSCPENNPPFRACHGLKPAVSESRSYAAINGRSSTCRRPVHARVEQECPTHTARRITSHCRINTCLLNRVPNGATTVNPRFSNLGGFCVGERTLTAPTHHSSRSPDALLRLCPPRTRRTVSSHTSHGKLRLIPGYNARPRGLFRRIL